MRPEVAPQRVAGELGNGAGHLHTGRPTAHDHDRKERGTAVWLRAALGILERFQQPPSDGARMAIDFGAGANSAHSGCAK